MTNKYQYFVDGKQFNTTEHLAEYLGITQGAVRKAICKIDFTFEKSIGIKLKGKDVKVIINKNNIKF